MSARTIVRDAILAGVSGELDADAVRGVEWAAVDDTALATLNSDPFPDWDEYRAVAGVAL